MSEEIVLRKPTFVKVQSLLRERSGYNVYVKVIAAQGRIIDTRDGRKIPMVNAIIADQTGSAKAFFKGEQAKDIKEGAVIAIRNGVKKIIKGHISLQLDLFGRVTKQDKEIQVNPGKNISDQQIQFQKRNDRNRNDRFRNRNSRFDQGRRNFRQENNRNTRNYRGNRDNQDNQDREYRGNRDNRDNQDRVYRGNRDNRDNQDNQDNRNTRDYRGNKDNRDNRDNQDNRNTRDYQGNRDNRDNQDRAYRGNRDNRDNQDNQDNRNTRDYQGNRDNQDNRYNRDNRGNRYNRDKAALRDEGYRRPNKSDLDYDRGKDRDAKRESFDNRGYAEDRKGSRYDGGQRFQEKRGSRNPMVKIVQIEPGAEDLRFIAKVLQANLVKGKFNNIRCVLGDETGIVKAFLPESESLEVGNSVAIFGAEAKVSKEHIEITRGRAERARNPIQRVNESFNLSQKSWVLVD